MTYADLLQAVKDDLNRDDLEDQIALYVQAAIRRFQREFFYQSPHEDFSIFTSPTVTLYDIPPEFVKVEVIRMMYPTINPGGQWIWLWGPRPYEELLWADTNVPTILSPPDRWSVFGTRFRLYPQADGVYQLHLWGTGKIPTVEEDDSENFWTTDAGELIKYTAVADLRRNRIKDFTGADEADKLARREFLSIKGETLLKEMTGQIVCHL